MTFQWLRKGIRGQSTGGTRRPTARPCLQPLEDRLVPALVTANLTQGLTALALAQTIMGGGITITNAVHTGDSQAAGVFSGGAKVVGFDQGVVLGTGHVADVVGPNKADATSTAYNLPGDLDVGTLTHGETTADASALEFDFIPVVSHLTFSYVFSSEEYNENVFKGFDDAFGIFLNGKNLALLPCTSSPVSVDTVNLQLNANLFRNNDRSSNAPLNTEMDGLTVVLQASATVIVGKTYHVKFVIADGGDASGDSNVLIQAGNATQVSTGHIEAFGADAGGGPDVRVIDPGSNALKLDFLAYAPGFLGGVRTAVADVNGDGTPDVITVPGPTGGPDVRVWDGKSGQLIGEFMAYDPRFTGGLCVAAADVNGDGKADIITAPDVGGGPDVRVFNGVGGPVFLEVMAYSPGFRGGVRVSAGDVDGDGTPDIITGAGPGGGPHVEVFSGKDGGRLRSFFAYDVGFHGGVYVAAGSFGNAGGGGMAGCNVSATPTHEDIVTGAGAGGGPQVEVFDGITGAVVRSFFADFQGSLWAGDSTAFHAGVRVATADINADGVSDLLVTFGSLHRPDAKAFDGLTLLPLTDMMVYNSTFTGGVYVGAE